MFTLKQTTALASALLLSAGLAACDDGGSSQSSQATGDPGQTQQSELPEAETSSPDGGQKMQPETGDPGQTQQSELPEAETSGPDDGEDTQQEQDSTTYENQAEQSKESGDQ